MTASILIVVTHLLGAGHLTRAAAIGRAAARRGHRVTLVSGGRPMPLIGFDGLDLVQLPPVHASPDDFRTLRTVDGAPASTDYLQRRCALLLETLQRANPDVVVTELFPFGRRALAAEFEALTRAVEEMASPPALACSIRDILVTPSPAKVARAHDFVRQHYDAVLVHGDPALAPLEASWPVTPEVALRLVYTGYVDAEADGSRSHDGLRGAEIIVSGGSSAAALPLYRAALDAAARQPERRFRILIGHGVEADTVEQLSGQAGPNVALERARTDFRALLRGAALFIGQSGYNTALDVLATGVPALLVPFERGEETEQRLRAERLKAAGLAIVLPEHELDGPALHREIETALAIPPAAPIRVDRDGASRSAEILEGLAARRHATARTSGALG